MKKTILVLMMLCILSISVLASNNLERDGYWSSEGNTESGNYTTRETGTFFQSDSSDNTTLGADYLPLVLDLDEDGDKEYIITDGLVLKILDLNSFNEIVLEAESFLTHEQRGGMSAVDTPSGMRLIGLFGNSSNQTLYVFSYSGGIITQETTKTFTGNDFYSGVNCADNQNLGRAGGPRVCYFADYKEFVYEYFPDNDSLHNYNVSPTYFKNATPSILDFDLDGTRDVIFSSDVDNDGRQGYSIYDPLTKTISLTGDDLVSDASGSGIVRSVAFTNLDGGNNEIVVATDTHIGGGADEDTRIYVFNSIGVNIAGSPFIITSKAGNGVDGIISNAIIGDFKSDGGSPDTEICAIGHSQEDVQTLRCYTAHNNSITYEVTGAGVVWVDFHRITGADLDGDGFKDIITSKGVYFPNADKYIPFTLNEGGNIIVADLDGDGNGELIAQKDGVTWVNKISGDVGQTITTECSGSCIYYENFNYTLTLQNNDWFINPVDATLIPANHTFRDGIKTMSISHYYGIDLNPVISLRFNLTVTNLTDFISMSLRSVDGFNEKGVLNVQFYNGNIDAKGGAGGTNIDKNICTACYTEGENAVYELNIYFKNVVDGVFNNDTQQWDIYPSNSYVFSKNDVEKENTLPFINNISEGASINTNKIHFYLDMDGFVTIDDIIIWKGTNIDTTQDNTNASLISTVDLENETVCAFGFCNERGAMDTASFDCLSHPDCCGLIGGKIRVKSQTCVLGVILFSPLEKMGEWIMANMVSFIIVLGILVFIIPLIIYMRKH